MIGLEGTWHDSDNPKHAYRFQPNGKLASSWSGLPFGEFGTWERNGQTIKVHTIRNWDFEGTLNDGLINGHMVNMPDRKTLGPKSWKCERE
jgi:hypothetical protein